MSSHEWLLFISVSCSLSSWYEASCFIMLSVLFSAGRGIKMKAMQVISLTLLSVLAASAQGLKFGRCPKPAVQVNFDASRVNTQTQTLPAAWYVHNTAKMKCSVSTSWCVNLLLFPLQYIGKWYEIQKLPTAFQKGECGTATYSAKSPGVIGVFNQELLWVQPPSLEIDLS